MRPWSFTNFVNNLWEIYKFGAVGDKDELVRFLGQKVKGQGHSDTTYSEISTSGGIFSLISGIHVLF